MKHKKVMLLTALLMLLCSPGLFALPGIPSLNLCPDIIFNDPFENDSVPSEGVGGTFPSFGSRTVTVAGITGDQIYYYFIPSSYDPDIAMPMMMLWHGLAGAGNAASQARAVRGIWTLVAEQNNLIIVAQIGTSAEGSWVTTDDYLILNAIMADMEDSYNIETTRKYGWGFSAGGHFMHDIWLQDSMDYAAYAVNAGILGVVAGTNAPANAGRVIPVYVAHGVSDNVVPFNFALSDRNRFLSAGWVEGETYWLDDFAGFHEVLPETPQNIWDQICTKTVLD